MQQKPTKHQLKHTQRGTEWHPLRLALTTELLQKWPSFLFVALYLPLLFFSLTIFLYCLSNSYVRWFCSYRDFWTTSNLTRSTLSSPLLLPFNFLKSLILATNQPTSLYNSFLTCTIRFPYLHPKGPIHQT